MQLYQFKNLKTKHKTFKKTVFICQLDTEVRRTGSREDIQVFKVVKNF